MKKWETPKVDELTIANTQEEEARAAFWICTNCCKELSEYSGEIGNGQKDRPTCLTCGPNYVQNVNKPNYTCKIS